MIPLHSLLLYAGIYAGLIAIPGPNVIAILARALAGGFRAAIPASFGTALGDIVLMTVPVVGLSAIAHAPDAVLLWVRITGVLYLLWTGLRYWKAGHQTWTDGPDTGGHSRGGFAAQVAVTIGNPKGIAFFLAVLPNTIDLRGLDVRGYAELAGVTLVLIPAITLVYAAAAARARHFLSGVRARRRLNRGAAIAIMGAALGIAVSG